MSGAAYRQQFGLNGSILTRAKLIFEQICRETRTSSVISSVPKISDQMYKINEAMWRAFQHRLYYRTSKNKD
jgi:hypothetical protein